MFWCVCRLPPIAALKSVCPRQHLNFVFIYLSGKAWSRLTSYDELKDMVWAVYQYVRAITYDQTSCHSSTFTTCWRPFKRGTYSACIYVCEYGASWCKENYPAKITCWHNSVDALLQSFRNHQTSGNIWYM